MAFCASLVASGDVANMSAIIIATGEVHSSMPTATACSPLVLGIHAGHQVSQGRAETFHVLLIESGPVAVWSR